MLVRFSIENYLSFKGKIVLNFQAGTIKEYPHNVFESAYFYDTPLLKAIALYGANSSGKSNILKAFYFLRNFVLNSSKESQSYESIAVEPFKLSTDTENEPSTFEVIFLLKDKRYRYGFTVNSKSILSEWLFLENKRKSDKIYIRANQSFDFSKTMLFDENKQKVLMLSEVTRENALFLSVLAQFNTELGRSICDWFASSIIIFDASHQEMIDYTAGLLSHTEYSSRINQILQNSDLGFSSIEAKVKEVAHKTKKAEQLIAAIYSDDNNSYNLLTKHKKYTDDKHVDTVYFDLLKNESLGTQKYFGLLGPIIQALLRGSILFVDELDSRFHPLLLNIILKLFNSKMNNPNGAQLIFTLHNTDPLKKILRRDQMYFMEKDTIGASTFQSLHEKLPTVRKDASFEKEYLLGKYGAIPNIINSQLNLFSPE